MDKDKDSFLIKYFVFSWILLGKGSARRKLQPIFPSSSKTNDGTCWSAESEDCRK